jgi:atypical dual specificity phosphatase
MDSFSWVIERRLGGMQRPGRRAPLDDDLSALRRAGVTAIVSLLEQPELLEAYRVAGFRSLQIALRNFGVPSLAQIEEFCAFVDDEAARGGAVVAHCQYGVGRTGVMLIAYLIHRGMTFQAAADEVRQRRPGTNTDSAEREEVLREFERLRRVGR